MQLQFKGTNYELTEDDTNLVTKKFEGIKKYLGTREAPAHAYVDLGKFTEAHAHGNVWYAECNLDVLGKHYYAKSESDTLRTAIDGMCGELSREIRTAHKKETSLVRKNGSRLKDFFRFGR